MNVLVACEESQTVTKALRERGHEAYSCDVLDTSGDHSEWHIKADMLPLLNGDCNFCTMDGVQHTIIGKWDMIIAFPPCTKTTNAGARHLYAGGKLNIPRYYEGMCGKALFMAIYHAECDKIAIENPTPSLVFNFPEPSQIIQPYEFGELATKRTCLWLKGLPPLVPRNPVPRPIYREIRQKNGKIRKTCWVMEQKGGKDRARKRAKTFPGVAKAMAEQWTNIEK